MSRASDPQDEVKVDADSKTPSGDELDDASDEFARLKLVRRAAKGALTRACNELCELMKRKDVLQEVNAKVQVCSQKFAIFQQRHIEFHELITDDAAAEESSRYFHETEQNFQQVMQSARSFIEECEQQLQDTVAPHDSVSHATSRGTNSSLKSALIKAHAKRAALEAEAEALKEMQALEKEKMELEQRQKQLQLQAQIRMAEAEETVYNENLDEVSVKSKRSLPIKVKAGSSDASAAGHKLNPQADEFPPSNQAPEKFNTSICDLLRQGQQQQQTLVDMMHLPKTELPSFDGDPLKYWQFIRAFDNMVDRLNADFNAKLTRLVQYCTGKALKVVECCLVMSPELGYKRARELLAERFGNSYVISEAWIQRVSQGETLRPNDFRALQEFADNLRGCKETLDAMNLLSEVDTQKSLARIVARLPTYLQNRWRREAVTIRRVSGCYPDFKQLVKFVDDAAEEANDPVFGKPTAVNSGDVKQRTKQTAKEKKTPFGSGGSNFGTVATEKQRKCTMCSEDHSLFACKQFKEMKPEERFKFVRSKRLCDNCLLPNHIATKCRKQSVCSVPGCNKKHTRFIHISQKQPKSDASSCTSEGSNDASAVSGYIDTVQSSYHVNGKSCHMKTALPIVPVRVIGKGGKSSVTTLALLDGGSTNTFCSDDLLDQLSVRGEQTTLSLTTLEKENSETTSTVAALQVVGLEENEIVNLPCVYSKPKLPIPAENLPSQKEINKWPHLQSIDFPKFDTNKVTILIGQDVPEALIPLQVVRRNKGEPYAVRSVLGWTINGPLGFSKSRKAAANFVQCSDNRLEQQLEKFWQIDSTEALADGLLRLSQEDQKAVTIWDKSAKLIDGHYQMAIPFRNNPCKLPNNRVVAEVRLQSLKKRLEVDKDLYEKYKQGITDLVKKGYAELVTNENPSKATPIWYLPHHPVLNPNKPGKVRIVFDCSAKYQETSLNDHVLQGPDLTNKLLGVLLRFRQGSVAVMGDIEAMYHQVRVNPCNRDALRFLWWKDGNPDSEVVVFRMAVHLFGGIWSPSAANYALRKTAHDNSSDFDQSVVETVHRNFYVDDCLKSVDTADDAIRVVKQLRELLSRGGFNIVKWVSNEREVLKAISVADRAPTIQSLDLDQHLLPTERALGVRWNTETDCFEISVKMIEKPYTRRGLVSIVSSIYDPLGFISPLVLLAKRLFQELSRRKLAWDDQMPDDLANEWTRWRHDILKLETVNIPRHLKPNTFGKISSSQLHHFADASQVGFGAVSYLRLTDEHGNVHCVFLVSKSRLAPLKSLTVPRLELSAAVVAARLDSMLRRELELPIDQSVFWTDSTIVLQYLKNKTKRFHTFVANRVAMIHEITTPEQWHHISSAQNPADMVSRGLTVDEFLNNEWLNGPAFLYEEEDTWSEQTTMPNISDNDPEVRKSSTTFTTVSQQKTTLDSFIERYSSWNTLKNRVAWFLRLRKILMCKARKTDIPTFESRPTVAEIQLAEEAIVRYVQLQHFADTLDALSSKAGIKSSDKLSTLAPVLDAKGLLCIGGRLKNAPVHHRAKGQMILPRNHHIVTLLIRHHHELSCHSGPEYVLSQIRQHYWILRARVVIKAVLRKCIQCKRQQAKPASQMMADLPADRVTPYEPAFTSVGLDCFGPFLVKRGRSLQKRYGCIFTCLVIRAIHIEVLHSLDVHSFLNALHRFIARRGHPKIIRSDNGTNFTAAERELKEAMKEWNESNIPDKLRQKGVQWQFNPPSASHMGGVWERQIRTVRKVLGFLKSEQVLDDEGLTTLMCLVEAVVNSRPITKQSDDPRDLEAITPNHLLLLKTNCTLPPGLFCKEDMFRRRWRQAQYLADIFWKRWLQEYLPTLQQRQKWLRPERNFVVGDIVLIVHENTPRGLWPLAKVIETYPAKDGLVRQVKVKTRSTVLTRPVHKLCLLEGISQ